MTDDATWLEEVRQARQRLQKADAEQNAVAERQRWSTVQSENGQDNE